MNLFEFDIHWADPAQDISLFPALQYGFLLGFFLSFPLTPQFVVGFREYVIREKAGERYFQGNFVGIAFFIFIFLSQNGFSTFILEVWNYIEPLLTLSGLIILYRVAGALDMLPNRFLGVISLYNKVQPPLPTELSGPSKTTTGAKSFLNQLTNWRKQAWLNIYHFYQFLFPQGSFLLFQFKLDKNQSLLVGEHLQLQYFFLGFFLVYTNPFFVYSSSSLIYAIHLFDPMHLWVIGMSAVTTYILFTSAYLLGLDSIAPRLTFGEVTKAGWFIDSFLGILISVIIFSHFLTYTSGVYRYRNLDLLQLDFMQIQKEEEEDFIIPAFLEPNPEDPDEFPYLLAQNPRISTDTIESPPPRDRTKPNERSAFIDFATFGDDIKDWWALRQTQAKIKNLPQDEQTAILDKLKVSQRESKYRKTFEYGISHLNWDIEEEREEIFRRKEEEAQRRAGIKSKQKQEKKFFELFSKKKRVEAPPDYLDISIYDDNYRIESTAYTSPWTVEWNEPLVNHNHIRENKEWREITERLMKELHTEYFDIPILPLYPISKSVQRFFRYFVHNVQDTFPPSSLSFFFQKMSANLTYFGMYAVDFDFYSTYIDDNDFLFENRSFLENRLYKKVGQWRNEFKASDFQTDQETLGEQFPFLTADQYRALLAWGFHQSEEANDRYETALTVTSPQEKADAINAYIRLREDPFFMSNYFRLDIGKLQNEAYGIPSQDIPKMDEEEDVFPRDLYNIFQAGLERPKRANIDNIMRFQEYLKEQIINLDDKERAIILRKRKGISSPNTGLDSHLFAENYFYGPLFPGFSEGQKYAFTDPEGRFFFRNMYQRSKEFLPFSNESANSGNPAFSYVRFLPTNEKKMTRLRTDLRAYLESIKAGNVF